MEEHDGDWPTYRETCDALGFKSPNSVTQNVRALVKKGMLVPWGSGYRFRDHMPTSTGIPIRGIIQAGQLQEAVEANLGTITLNDLFPELSKIYALRVSGQSMVGADIHSGDYVLLVDDDIPNGGIGAILYNGETSLKRIYMDYDGLRLEPANPEYNDIRIEPDIFEEVTALGRYVGHVNKTGIHRSRPHSPRPRLKKITRFRPGRGLGKAKPDDTKSNGEATATTAVAPSVGQKREAEPDDTKSNGEATATTAVAPSVGQKREAEPDDTKSNGEATATTAAAPSVGQKREAESTDYLQPN